MNADGSDPAMRRPGELPESVRIDPGAALVSQRGEPDRTCWHSGRPRIIWSRCFIHRASDVDVAVVIQVGEPG